MKKIIAFLLLILLTNQCFADELRIVTKIIDGDTVILDNNETVRLIGINAAELNRPSRPLVFYAEESYKFIKQLCEGERIKLEFDEVNSSNNHINQIN